MRSRVALLLSIVLAAATVRADGPSGATSLLQGVRAFRADRYEEALVLFREAERAGVHETDLAIYLGPTLFKLGRFPEAREVLGRAHRAGSPDPVAEYYLGLTYYRLGLVRLAREVFLGLDRAAAGPKLAEGSARFIAAIEAMGGGEADVTRLLARAEAAPPALAGEALDDAREALLRARPGSPEAARASELVLWLGERVAAVRKASPPRP